MQDITTVACLTPQTKATAKKHTMLISLLAFVFCCVLCCLFLPDRVHAASYCGPRLTWTYTESTGTLTISGSGNMYNYDAEGAPWNSFRDNIKKVTISSSATSIGSYAFYGCSSLTSVSIPAKIQKIENGAFYYAGLTSLTVPAGVTHIGDIAFAGCPLASISVASGNPVYDSRDACNAVIRTASNTLIIGCKNTVIPSSVTGIGCMAYEGCTGLTSVSIPATVKKVGYYAFYGCTGLKKAVIPEGITVIRKETFRGCTALTSVTVPESVTSIEESAFDGCSSLTNVKYQGSEQTWNQISIKSGNICLTNAEITYADQSGECGTDAVWTFDTKTETLKISGKGAVNNYAKAEEVPWAEFAENIKTVTIQKGITQIGNYNFAGLTKLTKVTIPATVLTIGDYAFRGCTSLTSVSFPITMTTIGKYAFYNCSKLAKLNIPTGVTTMYVTSFRNCSGLTEISVNSGNTVYDSRDNCNAIIKTENNQLISGCNNTVIPESVTSISNYAFGGRETMKSVSIPVSVTHMRGLAFANTPALTDVYYTGTKEQWNAINITTESATTDEHYRLQNVTIHYAKTASLKEYLDGIRTGEVSVYTEEEVLSGFARNGQVQIFVIEGSADTEIKDGAGNEIIWHSGSSETVNAEKFVCEKNEGNLLIFALPYGGGNIIRMDGTASGKLNYTVYDVNVATKQITGSKSFTNISVSSGKHLVGTWENGTSASCAAISVLDDGGTKTATVNTDGTETVISTVTCGDVDGNGKITSRDAMLVLRYYAGLHKDIDTEAADVDGNGKVNSRDAMLILRHYAGLISVFPAQQ